MEFKVEWSLLDEEAFLHELLVLEHVLLLQYVERRSLFGKVFLWFRGLLIGVTAVFIYLGFDF
jgi:hypothetical protein